MITRVGAVVRSTMRAEDVGGRLGGDEFAVVLPYTRRIDAARVVGRLCEEIRSLSGSFEDWGSRLEVTASLGFETYDGTDLESVETLRRHAEVALKRAKLMGGDRVLYVRSLEGSEGGSPPPTADAERSA